MQKTTRNSIRAESRISLTVSTVIIYVQHLFEVLEALKDQFILRLEELPTDTGGLAFSFVYVLSYVMQKCKS